MRRSTILVIILPMLFVQSCDFYFNYKYEVTNNSDYFIYIGLLTTDGHDSTFQVIPGQSLELFETVHGNESKNGPYFDDVIWDIEFMSVMNSDSVISSRNYLENESWEFEENENGEGVYHSIVSNEEFN